MDITKIIDLQKQQNIFLSLPVTNRWAERSFSILRKVKAWLRSTTGEHFCTLNVRRERASRRMEKFVERLLTRFAIEHPRRFRFSIFI